MRIADLISKETKQQLNKIKSPENKQNKPKQQKKEQKKEKVNWPKIMGMNRDRYYRGKGGAFKSK